MINIGVLGVGHLGRIHLKLLKEIELFNVVGFYDPSDENAERAENEFGVKRYAVMDELLKHVHAVDIITPTIYHFECAAKAIKQSKHVFIEKPLTNTIKEAKSLKALAKEADVKVQVGHVERFNPAFMAARGYFKNPMFIEAHRLAQFNPRGTDVSVVLDLMIHDIDIVLSVVKSTIKRISASGVAVISNTPDITNARIEFNNGCVANLTASRMSMKNMRKTRFFQKDAYIAVDFLEKETKIIKLRNVTDQTDPFAMIINAGENIQKQIYFESPSIPATNAIKMELEEFGRSILNNTASLISIDDGYNALDVAYKIIDKIGHGVDFINQ